MTPERITDEIFYQAAAYRQLRAENPLWPTDRLDELSVELGRQLQFKASGIEDIVPCHDYAQPTVD